MRKIVSFLLLFSILSLLAFGNDVVVENPPFSVRNSKTLEIDKIEISDSETMLYITAYNKPKNWIRIDKGTYIRVNGEKYLIKSAKGIELAKEVYSDETGQMSFTLSFPSIDKNTQSIDFIESDCESCFKIWGIELHEGELKNKIEVPQEAKDALLIVNNAESLPEPKLEKGEATLSGRVLGYVPEMNAFVDVYVNNPILGEQERYFVKLSDDGSFSVKVPLICTMETNISLGELYRRNILLTPKEESKLFLDLQEKCRAESRNNRSKKEREPFVYNTGANCYINNWLANNSLSDMNGGIRYNTFVLDIENMTSAHEYKKYLHDKKETLLSEIRKLNVSGSLKEFLCLKATSGDENFLFMGYYHLPNAYTKKHKDDEEYESERIRRTFDYEYYSFIKDFPLDNPKMLYVSDYQSIISGCENFNPSLDSLYLKVRRVFDYPNIIDSLISISDMPDEDIKYANYLKKTAYENWNTEQKDRFRQSYEKYVDALLATNGLNKTDLRFANALKRKLSASDPDVEGIVNIQTNLRYSIGRSESYSDTIRNMALVYISLPGDDSDLNEMGESWRKKYQDQLSTVREWDRIKRRKQMLSEMLGFDSPLLFDLMVSQCYANAFETQTPLTIAELNYIKKEVSPFFYNYLIEKNAEIEAALLMAKKNQGYTVYSTPKVEDDVLFYEIIKPFEGKVVFVDFWGTWCGPCRSAMKKFEAAKKEFKGKDVVFVYIADETSPEEVWNNMIVLIDGEHYRLSISQFGYLKRKFKFSGVPSYLIIDKKGHQVYERTGFEGADKLSKIINDELSK